MPIPVMPMIIKNRKQTLFEVVSIEQFEEYLRREILNFKSMDNLVGKEREQLVLTLMEPTQIGIKKFRNVFVKSYINCQTRYNKKYWLQRGYSDEQATFEILKIQKGNNAKAVEVMQNLKEFNFENYKKKRNIYVEYWVEKGFSEEEAKIKLQERQSTYSLEKMKQKYGDENGLKKFNLRNEKWLLSLYGKMTPEQKVEFEKSKCVTKDKMILKYGEKAALEKWQNYIRSHSNMWTASGISRKYIDEILNGIGIEECSPEIIFYGSFEKNEFHLYDKETMSLYWYDLTFFDRKKIIEFDGVHVHSDPNAPIHERNDWKQAFTGKGYEDVLSQDNAKEQLAVKNGFDVLRVRLPKHTRDTKKEIVDQCVAFIKNTKK